MHGTDTIWSFFSTRNDGTRNFSQEGMNGFGVGWSSLVVDVLPTAVGDPTCKLVVDRLPKHFRPRK